jgi:sulfur carrier protein
MRILLNGDPKELPAQVTVQQLLDQLNIPAGRVACELNLKIIKRAFYASTVVNEGDTVEIIQAIGGG